MLKIEDLKYSYGKIQALNGVNFEVKEGEIMAIVGANGAGKSTLMRCIAGLLKPQEGKILYNDMQLAAAAHKVVEQGIALVPEGRWIFPNLTVEENLFSGTLAEAMAAKRSDPCDFCAKGVEDIDPETLETLLDTFGGSELAEDPAEELVEGADEAMDDTTEEPEAAA